MAKLETPSVGTNQVIELGHDASLSSVSVGGASRLTAHAVREGAETFTITVGANTPPNFVTFAQFGTQQTAVQNQNQAILVGDATFHAHQNGNGFSTQVNTAELTGSIDLPKLYSEQAPLKVKAIFPTEPVRHEGSSPFGGKMNLKASLEGAPGENRGYFTKDPAMNTPEVRNRAYARVEKEEANYALSA